MFLAAANIVRLVSRKLDIRHRFFGTKVGKERTYIETGKMAATGVITG